MAVGLTRNKNLSERNLNLKNALQKLYAPGIESDIELFSLSSSLESSVVSGQEEDIQSQIISLRNESIRLLSGEVQPRTKFITKFFTLTDGNKVYFNKFDVSLPFSGDLVAPKSVSAGGLYVVNIVSGGGGFYLLNQDGSVFTTEDETVNIENVGLKGLTSGATNARIKITLVKQNVSGLDPAEMERFTPESTQRYSIQNIEITSPGSGYIFPENLEVIEGSVRILPSQQPLALVKQRGRLFNGQPEIIKSEKYLYEVRGASSSGFFLYDFIENKYVYLNKSGFSSQEFNGIELRRFDGIDINNFLQFKFAQSTIYLNNYGIDSYRISEGSISSEINRIASVTNNLQLRTQEAIQNTRRPTISSSSQNILGYDYNVFSGADLVIWQRVVLRDPDFILNPSNPDFAPNSITGSRLKSNTNNFELASLDNPSKPIRVPGLFIKVGNSYLRAFSTTDKPFEARNSLGRVINPKINVPGSDFGALSAEALETESESSWYSYNSVVGEFAQRISPTGTNGAFYFHRAVAPLRTTVPSTINNAATNIYAIPLFTLVTS